MLSWVPCWVSLRPQVRPWRRRPRARRRSFFDRPLLVFGREGLLNELAAFFGESLDLGLGFFQALGQVLGQCHALLEQSQGLVEPFVARLELADELLEALEGLLERLRLGFFGHLRYLAIELAFGEAHGHRIALFHLPGLR